MLLVCYPKSNPNFEHILLQRLAAAWCVSSVPPAQLLVQCPSRRTRLAPHVCALPAKRCLPSTQQEVQATCDLSRDCSEHSPDSKIVVGPGAIGEARARGSATGGGGGSGGGSGGADAMLAATAAEVAAVLDSPGESAGVRCAAMEALFWLQARPTLAFRQGGFMVYFGRAGAAHVHAIKLSGKSYIYIFFGRAAAAHMHAI